MPAQQITAEMHPPCPIRYRPRLPDAAPITLTRRATPGDWTRLIARIESGDGEVLKQDGPTRVVALPADGTTPAVVIKRWELRTLGARSKSAVRMSHAWRHWRGAESLTKAGVATATCRAIASSRTPAGTPVEWLVMDRLPGQTLLHHLDCRNLTLRQELAVADGVARAMAAAINAGVWNRDGKPSNWIVTEPDAGAVAVIDCVAIRRNRPGAVYALLPALALESIGTNCLPRRALMYRVVHTFVAAVGPAWKLATAEDRRALERALWAHALGTIAGHGDPTPKVNPLETEPNRAG